MADEKKNLYLFIAFSIPGWDFIPNRTELLILKRLKHPIFALFQVPKIEMKKQEKKNILNSLSRKITFITPLSLQSFTVSWKINI